jgi:hypothetical protein
MKSEIYDALVALHGWCRGEVRRRDYAAARAAVPSPGDSLADPIERQARALLALVPADRRDAAIRRCAMLAGGLTLYEVRRWAMDR